MGLWLSRGVSLQKQSWRNPKAKDTLTHTFLKVAVGAYHEQAKAATQFSQKKQMLPERGSPGNGTLFDAWLGGFTSSFYRYVPVKDSYIKSV